MPTIVGKEASSFTINYYKGNPFVQDFTISGNTPATYAIARIVRINDPEKVSLIQFTSGSGMTINGQILELRKTANDMFLPPGWYEFVMEGVIGGLSLPFVQRSYFIVNDAIGSQIATPGSITATAVSSSQVNLVWAPSYLATSYTLQRSVDGLTWSTVSSGNPNTYYSDTGLSAQTLYYYRVFASSVGSADSGVLVTNVTTLNPGVSAGGVSVVYYTTVVGGESSFVLPVLIGRTVLDIVRSGVTIKLVTTGIPEQSEVLFTSATGQITFPYALGPMEWVRVMYTTT
jgi:hypothetical protein